MSFIFRLKAYNDGSIKEVINNAPLMQQNVSTGIGKFGKPCISFPGQRYQKIYTLGNILYGLNEFQISCWVKWSSPVVGRSCCVPINIEPTLSTTDITQRYPTFCMSSAYRPSPDVCWEESQFINSANNIYAGSVNLTQTNLNSQLDRWVYKTITFKNNIMKLYIDGKVFGNQATIPQSLIDQFKSSKNLYTRIRSMAWSSESQDYAGLFLLDDFVVSDKVIFDGEFTPPDNYLVDSYNMYEDKDSYLYGYK